MPNTQLVNGGGTSPTYTRRVFYTGTDTLYEGYALCYNFDAADQTPEGLTTNGCGTAITLADSLVDTPARRLQVEKPTWKNSAHFAGVISNKSSGTTGPGWVEINMPGSVCNIYTYANCDHTNGTTETLNTGQFLTFTCEQYYFRYSGFPGCGSALILGDVDRSTTAGLCMSELMTGVASGGVQVIESVHMVDAGVASLGGSIYVSPVGWTVNVSADAAFTAAASTLGLGAALGSLVAENTRKGFRNVVCLSAVFNAFEIGVSDCQRNCLQSIAVGGSTTISGLLDTASLRGEGAVFEWSGVRWVQTERLGAATLYTT